MWLEAGRKHAVRIIPQGGGPPALVRPGWFKDKEDFARRVEPFYQDMAEKYRDDPALLAWSLTEENVPVPWFLEAVADLTLQMAEWDPKHPMITMDNRAPSAWMNAQIIKPKSITRDLYVFFTDGLNGPYNAIGARSALTRECKRFLIVVNHDCNKIQPIRIELGYWPRLLDKEESLFDLRSGQKRDYQTLKLATLLPGDGTVFFVGTADEWGAFAKDFYAR